MSTVIISPSILGYEPRLAESEGLIRRIVAAGAGAGNLVIGSYITGAEDPEKVIQEIAHRL